MDCRYCKREKGHDSACPEVLPEKMKEWEAGYSAGRNNRGQESKDPTYLLGWVRGDVVADEFMNGYDPRFDGE